jgi:hypothetical protein
MTTEMPLPTSMPPAAPPNPAPAAARPGPKESSQGLICPNCAGVVPVAEGVRIVQCPYCNLHSLVQGERGVRRWQVTRRVDRQQAEALVRGFLSGMRKARDLSRSAVIDEVMLVYLPFWRVEATVAGWLFGRVRKDKDETKPDEHYVLESMHWNDAAVDVTEFGVHRIVVARNELHPFDSQALHAEAMVFEPSESRTEALDEARAYFLQQARNAAGQTRTTYENIQLLRPEFGLVYFPVWIGRYSYRHRTYQVVVDGVNGRIMYGKAPGNILFRAAQFWPARLSAVTMTDWARCCCPSPSESVSFSTVTASFATVKKSKTSRENSRKRARAAGFSAGRCPRWAICPR